MRTLHEGNRRSGGHRCRYKENAGESKELVKVLQEILGHSRIDVTLNVYAHVLPDSRRKRWAASPKD
jgi:integrase